MGKFPKLDSRKRPASDMPKILHAGGAFDTRAPAGAIQATTVFQPNFRTGSTSLAGPDIARCGGVLQRNDSDVITYRSNAVVVRWYTTAPDVAVVGWADNLSDFSRVWRTMFRFILQDVVLVVDEQSSLKSGPLPNASWWPYVTGARLKWYNMIPGAPEAQPTPVVITSDLEVRVGRTLYTGQTTENPFGSNQAEMANTWSQSGSGGPLTIDSTLPWASWGIPTNTMMTLALSQTTIDTWLKTITGVSGDLYLDICFLIPQQGAGVNFKQEIAAWGANQPTLEIDFLIP